MLLSELIEDKWYTTLYDRSGKFKYKKLENGVIKNTKWIYNNSKGKGDILNNSWWLEVQGFADMEEVYKYFPEEKPKKMELINGEYYYSRNNSGEYIFQCNNQGESCNNLNITNGKWWGLNSGYFKNEKEIRKAKDEEIQWFLACEKANKFIPKEEVLKSNSLKGKFKVGDRVRCTGNTISSPHGPTSHGWKKDYEFTINQITEEDKTYPIAWGTENGGGVFFDHLELVTEKAQNKVELTSLPERWYIILTPENRDTVCHWANLRYDIGKFYVSSQKTHGSSLYTALSIGHKNEITFDQFKKWVLKEVPKEENLVGRWVKALVDYPSSGSVKKGEYGIITKDKKDALVADFPSQNNYWCEIARTNRDKYEIMPIGFDPLKQKEINQPKKDTYEVGKWYKLSTSENSSSKEIKYVNYIKYNGVFGKGYIASEFINIKPQGNGYYGKEGKFNHAIEILEVPLSEIQQYLPEGHIDRIKSNEFKVGDWVVVLPEDEFYHNSEKCAQQIKEVYRRDRFRYLLSFKDGGTNGYDKIRHATIEEIRKSTRTHEISDSWTVNSSSSTSSFVSLNYGTKGGNNYTSGQESIIKINADVCNIKIAKSVPVTLKNTEKEVKINVKSNQKVTI